MKRSSKMVGVFLIGLLLLGSWSVCLAATDQKSTKVKATKTHVIPAAKASFDATKMGNMSGWDPANWVNPEGDTIRVAIVWPHSGPGALNGAQRLSLTTSINAEESR